MTDTPERDEQDPGLGEPPLAGEDSASDDEVLLAGDADADEPSTPTEPDYQDLYLRAAAETDNVRKRARRDVDAAHTRGVARLARELLPSLDNLERALEAAEGAESAVADSVGSTAGAELPAGEHPFTHGIRLVQQELLAALTRVGIEAFSPEGEQFDPHQHEAVAQVAAEGAEAGTITGVFQSGYRYKDEVLRPAKVTVAP